MDAPEVIDGLPLKDRATPKQLIYLLLASISLLIGGWMAKGYFDAGRAEVIAAINAVGSVTQKQAVDIERNAQDVQAIKRYFWTNSDQREWVHQLDRQNRSTVPSLVIPDVPQPQVSRGS